MGPTMKETTHYVSVTEAKANLSYWQMFENTFREQAARVLQRTWRRKKQLPYDAARYKETLTNNAKLLKFIQEPVNDEFKDMAEKIRQNLWLSLAFETPNFERALAQALRENLITTHEYVTANLLNQAKKDLGGVAAQFSFDNPNGPYQLSSISYADEQSRTAFFKALALLPPHEQVYFSVDFSRAREAIFFYECLQRPKMMSREIIRLYFTKLIDRLRLTYALTSRF